MFKNNLAEESQSAELSFARRSTEGRIVFAHYEFLHYLENVYLSFWQHCPFPVKEGRGDHDDRLGLTLKLLHFLPCKYLLDTCQEISQSADLFDMMSGMNDIMLDRHKLVNI